MEHYSEAFPMLLSACNYSPLWIPEYVRIFYVCICIMTNCIWKCQEMSLLLAC